MVVRCAFSAPPPSPPMVSPPNPPKGPEASGPKGLPLEARTVGGEGMPQEAEHKTAAVGEGDAAEAEGYSVPQGGAGRIHHDIHYLLKYKST